MKLFWMIKTTLFCLFCWLVSCDARSPKGANLIKEVEGLHLKPTGYTLFVEKKDNLVHIRLLNTVGEVVEFNKQASSLQKWFLFWDKRNKRLWLSSSDIGQISWDLSSSVEIKKKFLTKENKELVSLIPAEVRASLSRPLKKELGIDE